MKKKIAEAAKSLNFPTQCENWMKERKEIATHQIVVVCVCVRGQKKQQQMPRE